MIPVIPYCKFCKQETSSSDGCLITSIEIEDGELVPRMPYTQLYSGEDERCHDCGAKNGKYHHPRCDMEICPRCVDQLICCDCDITGALKGIQLKVNAAAATEHEHCKNTAVDEYYN